MKCVYTDMESRISISGVKDTLERQTKAANFRLSWIVLDFSSIENNFQRKEVVNRKSGQLRLVCIFLSMKRSKKQPKFSSPFQKASVTFPLHYHY